MAALPVTLMGIFYPRNKTDAPYPATFVGFASLTGLSVGGGPIVPPDEIGDIPKPPGDWEIWPNPPEGTAPIPEHPIVLPDPILPPDQPPATPQPPHQGWNWSQAKSGWYFLYVPGASDPGPKA